MSNPKSISASSLSSAIQNQNQERVLSIRWADQRFDLHADRAVYWPGGKSLLIADPHFGKAAAFRARGVPVPRGTTQHNLDRLTRLLAITSAQRLIILGDFLHARDGRADDTFQLIADWRNIHQQLQVMLVRGNHDENAGDPPPDWKFCCVDEPFIEDGFAFRHQPADASVSAAPAGKSSSDSATFSFAGHVHPCAILHDVDGSSSRVACFHFSKSQAVLPAFGAFTGMHPVRPRQGDRIFITAGDCVIEAGLRQPRS